MKKIIGILFLSTMLVLSSCKTATGSETSTEYGSKVNFNSQKNLIGTWTLNNVSYSEKNIKVKAFDDFDAKCLENSTWFFIANDNKGNYTIDGSADCPSVKQNFRWYIDKNDMFVLKLVDQGEKAKNVKVGTTYLYSKLSDTEFTLKQKVSGVDIVYHFSKLSSGKIKNN